jgi:3-methylfumaryl-CoA hydratase
MFDKVAEHGEALPQSFHFCLCTPEVAMQEIGEDGHPMRNDDPEALLPPIPLSRRMWAASDITFLRPLGIAQRIERTSTVTSITEKDGKTGKLAFVELAHSTTADGEEAIRESQTLVYRDAAALDAPLSPPTPNGAQFDHDAWDASTTLIPDPRLLFRFSALTFNTHRIHYDLPYARDIERYRGLVVHGPLIASLLMQLVADTHGDNALASFSFRAVSPAIAGEQLHLAMRQVDDGIELGAFADDGRQTMKASAVLA